MMGKLKKALTVTASLLFCLCSVFGKAYAAEGKWGIENTLDAEECRQGGTLLLAVALKGDSTSKGQEITSLRGVLEYDTSLFTMEKGDILPGEAEAVKACSFDASDGTFAIQYASAVTVKDGSQLLQLRLHVAQDATIGKTTVCVTQMEWGNPDKDQKEETEHRVPARITIREAQAGTAVGDVNGDGKVDLTDARLAMQHYNGIKTLDAAQQKRADTNGDNKVNLIDVKRIMQYYNGEIEEFP